MKLKNSIKHLTGCELLPTHEGIMLCVSNQFAIRYDLKENSCSNASPTQFDHLGTNVVALGNRIFVLGGSSTDLVEEYDYINDKWIVMNATLQIARRQIRSVVVPAQFFRSGPGGCKGIV